MVAPRVYSPGATWDGSCGNKASITFPTSFPGTHVRLDQHAIPGYSKQKNPQVLLLASLIL